jgi:hypothetical protein
MLFGFGVDCLYSGDHVPNACVYLIQLFLLLKSEGEESLNLIIPEVLKQVMERANHRPMNKVLKRIIYGVVLAAMMSNHRATFEYLSSHNLIGDVFESVINFSVKRMENGVERKLHAVVLTNLLTQEELPDILRDASPKIIQKIVEVLVKTTSYESKKAKKKDKKSIEFNDDDFDSDFDSEDTDSEDDSEGEDSDGYRHELMNNDEEEKKNGDDGDSTDENGDEEVLETEIDVQSAFSIIKTGFNTFDEFNYFKYVMSNLYANHGVQMEQLISQLPENINKAMQDLMQVQKVKLEDGKQLHRKVIKAKRNIRKQ